MTNKFLLFISMISILGSLTPIYCQNQRFFNDSFCKPVEIPMMAFKGESVLILCDTVYIVNKYRMNLYEIAKETIMNNNQNVTKLIQAYDRTLFVVSSSYDSLLFNYRKLDELFRTTIQESQQTLNNTRSDLEKATSTLNNTEKMLKEAEIKLDKRDTKSIKRKAVFFGSGLLAGILLMLIIN